MVRFHRIRPWSPPRTRWRLAAAALAVLANIVVIGGVLSLFMPLPASPTVASRMAPPAERASQGFVAASRPTLLRRPANQA